MTDRPLDESYWVEPNQLLAGEYPGKFDAELTRQRIDALIEAGFNTFIDLTKPNETVAYVSILFDEAKIYEADVKHIRFPIGDFGLPSPELMNKILNAIEEELQAR